MRRMSRLRPVSTGVIGNIGILWQPAQNLVNLARRALGIERRLTLEECHDLLQLSETVMDHGRMLQSYFECPMDHVMIEVPELAYRLREAPETVAEALLLLQGMGLAEPFSERHGSWRLRLTPGSFGDLTEKGTATSA